MIQQIQTELGTLSAAQYKAFLRVSHTIAAHRSAEELFRGLTEALSEVVSISLLSVILYDEETHTFRLHAFETFGRTISLPNPEIPLEETTIWWVYQHQRPLVIPSIEKETRFLQEMAFLKQHGIRSNCGIPLTTAHRQLGAFSISSEQENAYSEENLRFLSLISDQIALSIGDWLNLEASQKIQAELQKKTDRLKLVLEVNNSVASNLELKDLLHVVSVSIRQIMQCDAVCVALPDCAKKQLRISAFDFPAFKGDAEEETPISIEGTYLGRVFQTQESYLTGHSEDLPGVEENLEGLQSACIVPLMRRQQALGVLALARFEENHFTLEDLDFLTQIATQIAIAVENAVAYGQIAELKEQLAQEKLYLEDEIRSEMNFKEVVGKSPAIRRVLREVETVAPSDSTVLILGETGTGKELMARAIHDLSSHKQSPFVKLNCAAIPTGLLESELFGHEKGAFTGAIAQHVGRFELAHRGTVFLDEIGDIPLELQPKLLRVLQEREFQRLGSSRTLRTDARLIAATNRDLQAMVEAQQFRADLFYRLHVFPISLPPLRARQEDIPLLVRHFAQQFARRMNKRIETISTETMDALVHYHWPGNIRELQNIIERAVILSKGRTLRVPITELRIHNKAAGRKNNTPTVSEHKHIRNVLEETERKEIVSVLEETDWVVAGPRGAAARLGMKRSTLQFRMQKLGISRQTK